MHAIPAMGRGVWENAAMVNTGDSNYVAFVMSDDNDVRLAPVRMYVGYKNYYNDGSFLDRNGLKYGKTYAWVANDPNIKNAEDFHRMGQSETGYFVELLSQDVNKAGDFGYDDFGWPSHDIIYDDSINKGAFLFWRVEDIVASPDNQQLVAFALSGISFVSLFLVFGFCFLFLFLFQCA